MNLLDSILKLWPTEGQGSWRCLPHLLLCLVLSAAGCGDKVRPPTAEQLAAFEKAGRPPLAVDMNAIRQARLPVGSYRVVPGDVLEFTMPLLLQAVTVAEVQAAQTQGRDDRPFVCRVSPRGTIGLPGVGEVAVGGASLAEIEEEVIGVYRDYVVLRPSIFVRVLEYETSQVSIMGAVAKPGVYSLRHDQMSLVSLLMEAGGIVEEGAATIRVARANGAAALSRGRPSGAARVVRETRTGRATTAALVSKPVEAGGRFGLAGIDSPARAVFQREGPLYATGWLTVEQDDQVLAHGWLDLASECQRKAFLQAAAARSHDLVADDLQSRLSRLASHLEPRQQDSATGPALSAFGWQGTTERQFVCRFPEVAVQTVALESGAGADAAGATMVLPVVGFNIPFHDLPLQAGDTVVVEHIQEPLFTVLGLVNRAGNFPYPRNTEYNIAEAIAFAQGLDRVADPRYVTVYRLTEEDEVVRITFRLVEDDTFTDALKTVIRPGDVVAVENTPRTRANTTINNLLRLNAGVYVTGRDLWNNE